MLIQEDIERIIREHMAAKHGVEDCCLTFKVIPTVNPLPGVRAFDVFCAVQEIK